MRSSKPNPVLNTNMPVSCFSLIHTVHLCNSISFDLSKVFPRRGSERYFLVVFLVLTFLHFFFFFCALRCLPDCLTFACFLTTIPHMIWTFNKDYADACILLLSRCYTKKNSLCESLRTYKVHFWGF